MLPPPRYCQVYSELREALVGNMLRPTGIYALHPTDICSTKLFRAPPLFTRCPLPRYCQVYSELREALVGNMLREWTRTGYFWEQYDPVTGKGQRTHPFNGWSSLALLAMAEVY